MIVRKYYAMPKSSHSIYQNNTIFLLMSLIEFCLVLASIIIAFFV